MGKRRDDAARSARIAYDNLEPPTQSGRLVALPTTSRPRKTRTTSKNTREQLDIITSYQELGSYRAAAKLCGPADKSVKQIVLIVER